MGVVVPVVRARVGHRVLGPQPLEQGDRLRQPLDADTRRVVADAEALVVTVVPSGADAELEPAVRDDVDGGRLAREEQRIAEVVVEHEGTDAKRRRRRGRGRERRERRQAIADDVIGHDQSAVADGLEPSRERGPVHTGGRHACLHREAEAPKSHGPRLAVTKEIAEPRVYPGPS